MQIRPATQADALAISRLVQRLARDYITHEFSSEGTNNLLAKMTADAISGFMDDGFRYHIAEHDGDLAGVVATRDNRHLYHLFVAPRYQRRGLARQLWAVAREACLLAVGPGRFTVNSSRYAVEVYRKLGFTETGPPVEQDGVICVPMRTAPCLDVFTTDRLRADRLRPTHRDDYRRLFQDPRVMATLSPDGEPLGDEQVERWLRLGVEHWERYDFGFWAFRDKTSQRFVGRAGLKHVEILGQPEVELGYALVPDAWGKGLATELSRAIVSVASEQLGLEEIICYTLTTNRASRRVMEKVGFRFQRHFTHVGLPHDLCRISAAEFLESTGNVRV